MPALLKLIPLRDYLYGAIILALLAFGIHYRNLEHEVHQVAAVGKAAVADVKKVDKAAQSTETTNAIIYEKAVTIPAVGDLGLVCKHTGGSALPAPSASEAPGASQRSSDSPEGPPYDPSGAVLTRGREADAQITYLQQRIKELEAQMNGAP